MDFSSPYIKNPIVLVASASNTSVNGVDDLRGKSIAIVKGYFFEDIFRENYPDIKIVQVSGFIEGVITSYSIHYTKLYEGYHCTGTNSLRHEQGRDSLHDRTACP